PTPPFWFATVSTRRLVGRGMKFSSGCSTFAARSASSPIGVDPPVSVCPAGVVTEPLPSQKRARGRSVSRGTCLAQYCSSCAPLTLLLRPLPLRTRPLTHHALDHDHGRRSVEDVRATLRDAWFAAARLGHRRAIALDLVRRAGTFECDQRSGLADQGQTPAGETGERSDRTGRHHIREFQLCPHGLLLGTAANHGDTVEI